MRTIIIPDIHGCFNELVNLIDHLKPTKEDHLIFLGDYFDRGPDSGKVFKFLLELEKYQNCTFLMGNHELMAIDYAEDLDESWIDNGYMKTLESFVREEINLGEWLQWLRKTKKYYENDHFIACHGDPQSGKMDREDLYDVVWGRDSFINGDYNEKLAIIGHTPLSEGHPIYAYDDEFYKIPINQKMPLPPLGLLNIDTACVYSVMDQQPAKLTGLVITEEKGRDGTEFMMEAVQA